jgi:hypothetical protein
MPDLFFLSTIFGFVSLNLFFSKIVCLLNFTFYSTNFISNVLFFNKLTNKVFMRKGRILTLSTRYPSALFFFLESKKLIKCGLDSRLSPPRDLSKTARLAAFLY